MAHPEQLGKYVIKTLLGEGAMGVVYKALDPSIGRMVAIKTIRHQLSGDREAELSLMERFRNEARAVGRLTHPGIVAIYELGQDREQAYIVMEYVEGRDLSQILAANPTLPESDVLTLMGQLLDALSCAHQQGVWHRDIKPANLIISASGQLKVTDFGIARIESAALTRVTTTIGTPGYMAPEQYTGGAFDQRVDIFASGVLLYRLLTGQPPFTGTPEAVMYGIMTKTPAPLDQFVAPDVATFYAPIVARALAKDPAQRFPTAAAFREALQRRGVAAQLQSGEMTVIAQAAQTVIDGRVTQGLGPWTMGNVTSQTSVTNWEDATLAKVQAALARFMGPMAKIQVRQAAKKCANLPDLLALLAQDIPGVQDRVRFLEIMQHPSGISTLGTADLFVATRPHVHMAGLTGAVNQQALPAPMVERATMVMTRLMGPIAKIVVKKAAARAQSPPQFLALLAQELPEGPQRSQLITDMS